MSDEAKAHVEARPAALVGESLAAVPAPAAPGAEPVPIWFFVGLILLTYGVIIAISGLVGSDRPTVMGETRPAIWWGALMTVAGGVFLGIGLKGRTKDKP